MAMSDTLGDMLTRIRNGQAARMGSVAAKAENAERAKAALKRWKC
jgi:ribosomal protein S8